MAAADSTNSALEADWKGLCRRATERVRGALAEFPDVDARGAPRGTGRGGDTTMAIDLAAEDIVIDELEALGLPLTLVSEERGVLDIGGGSAVRVVVDPIDGSRNAKRRVPFFALSIAVAEGGTAGDVVYGFVSDLTRDEEWWAERGGGAFLDGQRLAPLADGELELLGLETTRPELLARAAPSLEACGASRVRSLGSIALSMCWVAAGWLDAMASLRPGRSIDLAAAQLVVREAGGVVALPDVGPDPLAAPLTLEMRSRVYAASGGRLMKRVLEVAA